MNCCSTGRCATLQTTSRYFDAASSSSLQGLRRNSMYCLDCGFSSVTSFVASSASKESAASSACASPLFMSHLAQHRHRCFAHATPHSVLLRCAECGAWSYLPRRSRHPHYRETIQGICNLGSTCYLSAALQLLLANRRVLDMLERVPLACRLGPLARREEPALASASPAGGDELSACVACELSAVMMARGGSGGSSGSVGAEEEQQVLVPSDLLFALWTACPHIARYEQQDAHEFCLALVNAFDEHLRENHLGPQRTQRETAGTSAQFASAAPSLRQTFQGEMLSTLTCRECGQRSPKVEEFTDMSLSIPPPPTGEDGASSSGNSSTTLASCLAHFTALEELADPMDCSRCLRRTRQSKQLAVERAPATLLLHLKRFDASFQHKVTRHVAFPLDDLRVRAQQFRLVGAVAHTGSDLNQGHYVAYTRHGARRGLSGQPQEAEEAGAEQWFRCDDEQVQKCTAIEVAAAEAYLLMYCAI